MQRPPIDSRSTRAELRRWPLVATLGIAIAGVVVAAALTRLHWRVHTMPEYESLCAIDARINCDTVASSHYAVFAGLPVSVWGLLGFTAIFIVALWGLRPGNRGSAAAGLGLLAAASAAVSLLLGAISWWAIEAICLLCVATYGLSFAQAGLAYWQLGRIGLRRAFTELGALIRQRASQTFAFIGVLGAFTVILTASYPRYWQGQGVASLDPSEEASLATGYEGGAPWIGARVPRLTIVEFSDYECPFCRQAHQALRNRLKQLDDVRLVHRHFPLDADCNEMLERPFHQQACEAARLAVCAQKQHAFWNVNDYLYDGPFQREDLRPDKVAPLLSLDANELERCMAEEADADVQRDIEVGVALGVRATPTFVVNGRLYPGRLPDEVLGKTGP